MHRLGIVAVDQNNSWPGGRYYLHHIIRCVASLEKQEQIEIRDVYWRSMPAGNDPFGEVRDLIGAKIVVSPPAGLLPRLARKIRRTMGGVSGAADLFHSQDVSCFFPIPPCANTGLPLLYWCSDLQPLKRPDLISDDQLRAFREEVERRVVEAAGVVLSSQDACRDFLALYPDMNGKVHVVRFCSVPNSEWWACDPIAVAERYALPERFMIVCNQFTRHKNHMVLLEALRILKGRGNVGVHLVFTGGLHDYKGENYIDVLRNAIRDYGLQAQVSILGFISRSEQIALMRRSLAVVQPSMFEGWSTIVEDAKTLGKPLVLSNLSVHREQMGGVPSKFIEVEDAESWACELELVHSGASVGPSLADESIGSIAVLTRMAECGRAFVAAVRSVLPA